MNKLVLSSLNISKFYYQNKNVNRIYLGENLIYNNEIPETPEIPENPDLGSLEGILSKPISKFTNDDIGTIVSIPYTDPYGKILLNNGCIEFEVVGVNHHKDVNDESKPTITLMTKNVIRNAAFDAKEPSNPDQLRALYGNNRWSVSNIRQWLNSSGRANGWFIAQHNYDTAPDTTNIGYNENGDYADDPGFLAGFSPEIIQHFTDVKNTTAVHEIDDGGSEITVDKVFLASYTEMGFGNNNGIAEGTHLSIRYPDDNSRFKSNCKYYLTRSPIVNISSVACASYMISLGRVRSDLHAYMGNSSIAPLIVLS